MKLIEITKESLKENGIPFSVNTIYAWHSRDRYPEIFVKLGGRLFLNPEEWENVVKQAIKKSKGRASKIKKMSI